MTIERSETGKISDRRQFFFVTYVIQYPALLSVIASLCNTWGTMESWTLTTSEVARLILRSRYSVNRYARANILPSMRVNGGQRLYSIEGVAQFLREHGEKMRPKRDRSKTKIK
jgi:Helix-turn-helix domain